MSPEYDSPDMIRLTDLRGIALNAESAHSFVPRVTRGHDEVDAQVLSLMTEVRKDGAKALSRQSAEFDGVDTVELKVSSRELREAASGLDKPVIGA